MHWLLRVFVTLVCTLGALGVLFYFFQRRFLYFPLREDPSQALVSARRMGLEPWLGPDGGLVGWRSRHPSNRPQGRLLVLHGNAGSAANRVYFRDVFQAPGLLVALDVYLLEYPGYGPRDGTPSESSLLNAADAALDALTAADASPVYLLGESLGTAVVARAAADRPKSVAGLLLVTPLVNVPAVARRHFPFLPGFLIRDSWRTDRALPHYGGPIAFLVAGRDSIVFPELGEALYAAYPGPKRLWRDERADHNTLDFTPAATTWAEMLAFLREAGERTH